MNAFRWALVLVATLSIAACGQKSEFELPKLWSKAPTTQLTLDAPLAQNESIGKLDRELNTKPGKPDQAVASNKDQHEEKTSPPGEEKEAANQTMDNLKSAISQQWLALKTSLHRWFEQLKQILKPTQSGSQTDRAS